MEKSKIFSAVMACMALLLCISQGVTVKAQVPQFGTISGYVRDVDNRPITNVTIYLTNDTIKTFEDALSAGLALIGPGVSKLFPQRMVTEEIGNESIEFELAPGFVEGQVTDSVGNPVAGAEVSIDGISTVADGEGNFSFGGLYPGDYTVTASAKGESAEMAVTVNENETAYVTIALPLEPVAPVVVTPGVGEIEGPTIAEAHYVLKNVPPGTYTVNARALRDDGKVISGRAVNVVVSPGVTTIADIVLDVARPFAMVISAKPIEVSAYLEVFAEPATVEVTAQLLDYFGQPVGSGYEIVFSADMGTIEEPVLTTDASGRAVATYIADTPIAGEVLITAIYMDPETLVMISNSTTISLLQPKTPLYRERNLGSIKGKVMDINNRPISKAEIRIDGIVTETDEKGEFEIHGVVPGDYILSATTGNEVIKKIVTVNEGKTTLVSITIPIELQTYNHREVVNLPAHKEIYLGRGTIIEIKAHTCDDSPIAVDIFNSIRKPVYRKTSESGTIKGTYLAQSSDSYILEFWSPDGEKTVEIEYTITLHIGGRKEDIPIK